MTKIKILERRRSVVAKELGLKLESLIDSYGIENVINVLGALCEYRGNEMLEIGVKQKSIVQDVLGRKYLYNAKKLNSTIPIK